MGHITTMPLTAPAGRLANVIKVTEGNDRTKKVLLVCPAGSEVQGIIDAMYALYYLPTHFKLMVMADARDVRSRLASHASDHAIEDRVLFSEAGLSQDASLLSFADIVIQGNTGTGTVTVGTGTPRVIVTETTRSGHVEHEGRQSFTVSVGSPEALASAILHATRT